MAKIFINWIHTQSEALYASLCARQKNGTFTIAMVSSGGYCIVINKQ